MLESILFHLPMKDLIHAQQVSRQWRKTVASSPILRRHMFLKPGNVPIGTLYSKCPRKWNAVLQYGKHPHPYLERYFVPRYQQLHDHHMLFDEDYKPHILHILSWPRGQWEKMLIWQRPPTKVKIEVSCGCLAEVLLQSRVCRGSRNTPRQRVGESEGVSQFGVDDRERYGMRTAWHGFRMGSHDCHRGGR